MEMKSDLKTLRVVAAATKINRTHLEIEEGREELVKGEDGEGFSPQSPSLRLATLTTPLPSCESLPSLPDECAPVDPELESLISPLSQEQYRAIETSILSEGCRDPIVFWKEKGIIIDGHHRFSICRRNQKEFPLVELSFPDKEAVKAWIAENQLLLRRNANDPTTWYLRGVWYEAHRNTHGGDHKSQSKPHDEVLISPKSTSKSTSELAAEKFGVSPATIERDAQYKRAVDAICCLQQRWATPRNAPAIARLGGVQIRTLLLSGEIELKKAELIALGKQVHVHPEAVALKLGIALDFLGNPNEENCPLEAVSKEM